MRLAWFVALRFLRRRSSPLLSASSRAALVAVAAGVAALVVVLSLMNGYRQALELGIFNASGHLLLLPSSDEDGTRLSAHLASQTGVAWAGAVRFLPGLLARQPREAGEVVTLKACDHVPPFVTLPASPEQGPLAVAVGKGLSQKLKLQPGDSAFLQLAHPAGRPVYLPVKVVTAFESGFAELQESWVFCLESALRARLGELGPALVEVFLRDAEEAEDFAHRLEKDWPGPLSVRVWSEMNRELFTALRWQKLTLALVLSLIVGVGAFEVASSLVVLVTEKRRELGILQAVGASGPWLRQVVLLAGMGLGTAGLLLGLLGGVLLVVVGNLLGFPHFSPELAAVYMVDRIPWRLLPTDVLAVLLAGLVEVFLAGVLTARPFARGEPAEILRWV